MSAQANPTVNNHHEKGRHPVNVPIPDCTHCGCGFTTNTPPQIKIQSSI